MNPPTPTRGGGPRMFRAIIAGHIIAQPSYVTARFSKPAQNGTATHGLRLVVRLNTDAHTR